MSHNCYRAGETCSRLNEHDSLNEINSGTKIMILMKSTVRRKVTSKLAPSITTGLPGENSKRFPFFLILLTPRYHCVMSVSPKQFPMPKFLVEARDMHVSACLHPTRNRPFVPSLQTNCFCGSAGRISGYVSQPYRARTTAH